MSAKVLHSLTDENPDLHKQVGCMNGMFQVFNRRHFLTGRRIGSRDNKRLPPGISILSYAVINQSYLSFFKHCILYKVSEKMAVHDCSIQ